jgi:hypothetical protein
MSPGMTNWMMINLVGICSLIVIPGRPAGPNPESIFQRPVFMDSGFAALRRPGMTVSEVC